MKKYTIEKGVKFFCILKENDRYFGAMDNNAQRAEDRVLYVKKKKYPNHCLPNTLAEIKEWLVTYHQLSEDEVNRLFDEEKLINRFVALMSE